VGVTTEELNEVIAASKRVLFAAREGRIKPHRDEKILTAWNGLMLRAFAEAGRAFGRADYLQTAVNNAEFLVKHLLRDGRLLRTHKEGASKLNGYLEDYAYVADGMLALYESTFDVKWFDLSQQLVETMIEQFWDEEGGGFYFTSADHEQLVTRSKDFYDNATPAGNSVAADVLLRLALLTGEDRYRQIADRILRLMQPMALRAPSGFGYLLGALDLAEPQAAKAVEEERFEDAMAALATLREPIDRFFDEVMVNDEDPAKRAFRLGLLARFRDAVHRVADFSKIEG